RCDACFAGVVTMEFSERSLGAFVIGLYESVEHDFRSLWKGKSGHFAVCNGYRLFENRTDVVVLTHAKGNLNAGDEITQWIRPENDSDREGFSCSFVFLVLDAAMFAVHHVDPDMIGIVNHHAVRLNVNPLRIQVLGNNRATGPNIASAVQFVPERRWECKD